jgi:hypothetical protein
LAACLIPNQTKPNTGQTRPTIVTVKPGQIGGAAWPGLACCDHCSKAEALTNEAHSDEEEWQGFDDDPGETPLQPLQPLQPPPDATFESVDAAMPEEVIEEVNDDVPFELVNDVDYGGNAEVIESPVRPRRSGRERQATRRSLDYHKEMRKGR